MNKTIFAILFSSTIVSSSFAALDKSKATTSTNDNGFEYTYTPGDGKNNCNKKNWKFGETKLFTATWTLDKKNSISDRCGDRWTREAITAVLWYEFKYQINDFNSSIDYAADETKDQLLISNSYYGCIQKSIVLSYSSFNLNGEKQFSPNKIINTTNFTGDTPVAKFEYIHYKIGSFQNSNILEEDYKCVYNVSYVSSF